MRRLRPRALAAFASALYVSALALFLGAPTGLSLLVPGPALDAREMVVRTPQQPHEGGRLLATTVGTVPRTSVLNLIQAAFIPSARTIPRRLLAPAGGSVLAFEVLGRREMEDSKVAAAAAALSLAGVEASLVGEGAEILALPDPSSRGLEVGDVVVRANGAAIGTVWDLERAVQAMPPGEPAQLEARRGAQRLVMDVPARLGGRGRPTLGIQAATISPRVVAPELIEIEQGDMIGPSAGLMMALAVLERVSTRPLAGGYSIAGTGTITPEGTVGAVGGVAQKVVGAERAGAQYFLVPPDNYQEAVRVARRLQVVPVASLAEAVAFLRSLPARNQTSEVRPQTPALGWSLRSDL